MKVIIPAVAVGFFLACWHFAANMATAPFFFGLMSFSCFLVGCLVLCLAIGFWGDY